jgi:hypothetical protein
MRKFRQQMRMMRLMMVRMTIRRSEPKIWIGSRKKQIEQQKKQRKI